MSARATTARSVRRRSGEPAGSQRAAVLAVVGALVLAAALLGVLAVTGAGKPTASRSPSPGPAPSPTGTDAPVPDPTPTTAAGRWRAAALTHFQAMNSVLFPLVTTAQQWSTHKTSDADMHALVVKDLQAVQTTRQQLAALSPYPGAPDALSDYQGSVELYIASFQVLETATRTTDTALKQQLGLEQQRLRQLGDRVFDQATAVLQALDGGERQVEGTVVEKPAEVPDWRSIKLEAGPPLRAQTSPATPVRRYQQNRPTTSLAAWRAAVAGLGVPSGTAEATAVTSGTTQQLAALGVQLETASERLYALADPQGLRAQSTRTQLSLLVHAEVVTTAEAARLVPAADRPTLLQAARGAAAVGDALWSSRLPARVTPLGAPA